MTLSLISRHGASITPLLFASCFLFSLIHHRYHSCLFSGKFAFLFLLRGNPSIPSHPTAALGFPESGPPNTVSVQFPCIRTTLSWLRAAFPIFLLFRSASLLSLSTYLGVEICAPCCCGIRFVGALLTLSLVSILRGLEAFDRCGLRESWLDCECSHFPPTSSPGSPIFLHAHASFPLSRISWL